MVLSAAAVLLAYLVGAVPVGYLVGRWGGGGDIRQRGSGNIGATNVLRTLGRLPAALTLLADVAKGYVAVKLAAGMGQERVVWAAAVAAVIGNCWPVYLGFRGGKGVATGLGALLALVPWAVVPAVPVWAAVAATFRYVSLASLVAALCVPLGALLLGYPAWSVLAATAVAALVIVRHRQNIGRLLAGTEHRLGHRAS